MTLPDIDQLKVLEILCGDAVTREKKYSSPLRPMTTILRTIL